MARISDFAMSRAMADGGRVGAYLPWRDYHHKNLFMDSMKMDFDV